MQVRRIFSVVITLMMFSVPTWLAWGSPATSGLMVQLRVSANDRALTESESVPLTLGESVQLKVEVLHSDGSSEDVTAHPKTRYVSATPWILSVTKTGSATATSGLARDYHFNISSQNVGTILVSYGDPGDEKIGAASVLFDVKAGAGVVKDEVLSVSAPSTILQVGETVHLTVVHKLPDGTMRDLTDPTTGTTYFTTSESMLIPERDGRATCVGTRRRDQESAIIGVQNGKLYGSISFTLLPTGPGPSLEVVADKDVLSEGEKTQLHVYKPLPEGGFQDVTATVVGTQYLTFTGYGRIDPSVISITRTGEVSAPTSIGRYNRRTVVVFVRHANNVGWVQLQVVRATPK
ncbi:MAG: hypothetical protein ACE5JQ_01450 [Candidatus Methylomirabilales bacterium]